MQTGTSAYMHAKIRYPEPSPILMSRRLTAGTPFALAGLGSGSGLAAVAVEPLSEPDSNRRLRNLAVALLGERAGVPPFPFPPLDFTAPDDNGLASLAAGEVPPGGRDEEADGPLLSRCLPSVAAECDRVAAAGAESTALAAAIAPVLILLLA